MRGGRKTSRKVTSWLVPALLVGVWEVSPVK
jgi:hypothetical protein